MLVSLGNYPASCIVVSGNASAVRHGHRGAVAVQVVAVGVGIALCVGHGLKLTVCRSIAELCTVAEGVNYRRVPVKNIVLVAGHAAVCPCYRYKAVFRVIGIAYLRAIGIGLADEISYCVVGHFNASAQTVGSLCIPALCIVFKGFGGVVAIGDLYEISKQVVLVAGSSALGVHCGGHVSDRIVLHAGNRAVRIDYLYHIAVNIVRILLGE